MQVGLTQVSKKEFAIPPTIANAYAIFMLGDIAIPKKKIA